MEGVLAGLSVLELGSGIGPAYCCKLLADYGADVLKVEPPGGDELRAAGPFTGDEPALEGGGLFTFLNTSKQSVTIDWRTVDGQQLVARLLETVELVVHPFTGAPRDALGLAEGAWHERGLVEVAITPYGLSGPYADYAAAPLTMAALSGWMFAMGDPDKPPLYPGGPYISYLAGTAGATGALLALDARAHDGLGQTVDVAELEVAVASLTFDTVRFSYSGVSRGRTGELYMDSPTAGIFPCADGFVQLQEGRRLPDLLRMMGGEALAADERFSTPQRRFANRGALRELLADWLATQRRWELFEACGRRHMVFAAVPDMAEILQLAPHRERGYYHTLEGGPLAGVEIPGPPVRFGEGEWRCLPSPALGSANREVLVDGLGLSPDDVAALRAGGRI